VILNKPMEYVDASKRGLFYSFALREKQNRTIFLTTNFPHVASNLGDRIAILINGSLHACGTEKELIRLDKNVYRLVRMLRYIIYITFIKSDSYRTAICSISVTFQSCSNISPIMCQVLRSNRRDAIQSFFWLNTLIWPD